MFTFDYGIKLADDLVLARKDKNWCAIKVSKGSSRQLPITNEYVISKLNEIENDGDLLQWENSGLMEYLLVVLLNAVEERGKKNDL